MLLINIFRCFSAFLRSIFCKKCREQVEYFPLSHLPDELVLVVAKKIDLKDYLDVYCCTRWLKILLEVRRITPHASISCDVVTISSDQEMICVVCIDPTQLSIFARLDFIQKAKLQIVKDPPMLIFRLPTSHFNKELLRSLRTFHIKCAYLHISKDNSEPCVQEVMEQIQFRAVHRAEYITADFHYVMSQMLLHNSENE